MTSYENDDSTQGRVNLPHPTGQMFQNVFLKNLGDLTQSHARVTARPGTPRRPVAGIFPARHDPASLGAGTPRPTGLRLLKASGRDCGLPVGRGGPPGNRTTDSLPVLGGDASV